MGHSADSTPFSTSGVAAPGAGPVTVLVVDDQAIFRHAVRNLIEATPGFEQLDEAASGREALDCAAALRPDLVLLDVRMPEMDGIETARRLSAICPETKVVLISVEPIAELPEAVRETTHVRKQDLSPRTLQALWASLGGPQARA